MPLQPDNHYCSGSSQKFRIKSKDKRNVIELQIITFFDVLHFDITLLFQGKSCFCKNLLCYKKCSIKEYH